MNICEAIKALKDGHTVTRLCWDNQVSLSLNKHNLYIYAIMEWKDKPESWHAEQNDLFATDWMIWEKKAESVTMEFSEAITSLKRDLKIRRANWSQGKHLFLYGNRIYKSPNNEEDYVVSWIPNHSDLVADDWEFHQYGLEP